MLLFYLRDNLTIKGKLFRTDTISPLTDLSESSREILLKQGLIRELSTPPVAVFEPLRKHATLLEKFGIETLGDFAFHDFSKHRPRWSEWKATREELEALQPKAKLLIHPKNSIQEVQDEDCGCGESIRVIPVSDE